MNETSFKTTQDCEGDDMMDNVVKKNITIANVPSTADFLVFCVFEDDEDDMSSDVFQYSYDEFMDVIYGDEFERGVDSVAQAFDDYRDGLFDEIISFKIIAVIDNEYYIVWPEV